MNYFCIITGGSGFLGVNLVRFLLRGGLLAIVALS